MVEPRVLVDNLVLEAKLFFCDFMCLGFADVFCFLFAAASI
jgi:hypothetical protein